MTNLKLDYVKLLQSQRCTAAKTTVDPHPLGNNMATPTYTHRVDNTVAPVSGKERERRKPKARGCREARIVISYAYTFTGYRPQYDMY